MTAINHRPTTTDQLTQETATWPADAGQAWREAHDPLWGPLNWAPESRYTYARVFTRYLETARKAGLPEDAVCLLTPTGVKHFIRENQGSASPRTLHGYIHQLIEVAKVVNPEHIRSGKLDWLYQTRANLFPIAASSPKRRHDLLVSAVDLTWVAHSALVEACDLSGWKATQRYRDGMFILLGLYVPERRRALCSLQLDQIDLEGGAIHFDASQIKTRQEHSWCIPDGVVEVIQSWCEKWRPRYAQESVSSLFISARGTPVVDATLYAAMRELCREKLGVAVSPHIMRHASATTLLEQEPERADLVTLLLRHNSPKTRAEYTERANAILASRKASDTIRAVGEMAARELRTRRSH
ncbi:tyrosine-type recombinase/integrase [Fodinicurvata fenggangensis]|uniref:tyrosine-type recombinase/integrase n=1 Tax=Fodinicurvata fenggangensis TaxID=1121830 RepID=UPI00047C50B4|nr:site-specific integrase [Fodinicurvata fenggangensis]